MVELQSQCAHVYPIFIWGFLFTAIPAVLVKWQNF